MTSRTLLFSTLLLLVALACGGSANTGPLTACTGPVTATVTGATSPRFNWTPRCGLSEIIVNAAPSVSGVPTPWDLKAGSTLLAPGINYGVTPSGATAVNGPYPLQQGVDHVAFFDAPGIAQAVGVVSWKP